MAGYSGTPLPQKLGIKAGHRVAVLRAPAEFGRVLGTLPDAVRLDNALRGKVPYDVIVLFVTRSVDLARRFVATARHLDPSGGFWVAWPKKASGVATDVTEDTVRNIALEAGLVDNKVCAIDETWSGLRNVVRLADRPKATTRLKPGTSQPAPSRSRTRKAAPRE
jgi:hypothetical protein